MKNDRDMTPAASLLLLAVFAVCSVLVLLSGARVYSGIQARDAAAMDVRTAQAYLTARVRANDVAGAIQVADENLKPADAGPVLAITEEYGGRTFLTALYVLDGKLYELFAPADAGLGLEDGTPVLDLDDMSVALAGNVLTFSVPGREFTVALRSGGTEGTT